MDTLNQLIDALRCLPGVGPKSAQRMVFHLLNKHRERGLHLAECLASVMRHIKHCQQCNNYTEQDLCQLCQNPRRNGKILCIVETPADVFAIEHSHAFEGYYYILMGKISPLDGLGPDDIGLPKLKSLVQSKKIEEVILALSPTVEGQTTAHFIYQLLNDEKIHMSQLAHGIPSGGELEFLDSKTISNALRNRALMNV